MNPTYDQIINFLHEADSSFPVPLSEKQDLSEYAKKLIELADIYCAYENSEICSMVAGYIKNAVNNMGYISLVATRQASRGKGYASRLVKAFLSDAERERLDAVHLYTVSSNLAAVSMYKKLGFTEWRVANESRPHDLHLIFKFNTEDMK